MRKFPTLKKQLLIYLVVLFILLIPSFWRMLRPGIFSMQDFHIFRLFEYNRCIQDLQIPCRWSPDVAYEYGEPVFNFYGQLSYLYGEIYAKLGFSLIDSLKIIFISSLVFSGLSMFLLSKSIWKNNLAAFLSALIYVYAPYRAVDVFVRGALPEAFAFIFYPLVVYFFDKYVLQESPRDLLFLILSFTGLIINHNLSALMFLFFFLIWAIYFLLKNHQLKLIPKLLLAGVFTAGLTAFYILPVIFESKFVTLDSTVEGYYNFINHYVSLNQLLISRFWGYGGSPNGLSLSIGHVQWILPIIILALVILTKSFKKYSDFLILFLIGWFLLWLTHSKSIFFWNAIPPMKYIQFPWRFLGPAVFALSLAGGAIITFFKKDVYQVIVLSLLAAALLALNVPFFFEDLWYPITDQQQFSGLRYQALLPSSIGDYWPIYGKVSPVKVSPNNYNFVSGEGNAQIINKTSDSLNYKINITSNQAIVQIPTVYFPGWSVFINSSAGRVYPSGDLGLITTKLNKGSWNVQFIFENTPIRTAGDAISLISIFLVGGFYLLIKKRHD